MTEEILVDLDFGSPLNFGNEKMTKIIDAIKKITNINLNDDQIRDFLNDQENVKLRSEIIKNALNPVVKDTEKERLKNELVKKICNSFPDCPKNLLVIYYLLSQIIDNQKNKYLDLYSKAKDAKKMLIKETYENWFKYVNDYVDNIVSNKEIPKNQIVEIFGNIINYNQQTVNLCNQIVENICPNKAQTNVCEEVSMISVLNNPCEEVPENVEEYTDQFKFELVELDEDINNNIIIKNGIIEKLCLPMDKETLQNQLNANKINPILIKEITEVNDMLITVESLTSVDLQSQVDEEIDEESEEENEEENDEEINQAQIQVPLPTGQNKQANYTYIINTALIFDQQDLCPKEKATKTIEIAIKINQINNTLPAPNYVFGNNKPNKYILLSYSSKENIKQIMGRLPVNTTIYTLEDTGSLNSLIYKLGWAGSTAVEEIARSNNIELTTKCIDNLKSINLLPAAYLLPANTLNDQNTTYIICDSKDYMQYYPKITNKQECVLHPITNPQDYISNREIINRFKPQ